MCTLNPWSEISVEMQLEMLREQNLTGLPEMQLELPRDRGLTVLPHRSTDYATIPGWKTSREKNLDLSVIQKLIMALDKEPEMLAVNVLPLTVADRKVSKDFRDVLQAMYESMKDLARLHETEKNDERSAILLQYIKKDKLIEDEISTFVMRVV